MATALDGRRELGALLRARREALRPVDVGLSDGPRRRTPGLRREEVAGLAGVSTTYYTVLEQGRGARPSASVLATLADALRLTRTERDHVTRLAATVPVASEPAVRTLPPAVQRLVERQAPAPAFVKGRAWDVLAATPEARVLFRDWGGTQPRNQASWVLLDPAAREVYLDWELEARALLGRLRAAAVRHPGDAGLEALLATLRAQSPEVAAWWRERPVEPIGSGVKRLCHPDRGPLTYEHVVLQLADHPDLVLVAFDEGVAAAPGRTA